jgi:aerobic C4-dicarboxylate transport protein
VPADHSARATETPVVSRPGPGPLRKQLWFWVLIGLSAGVLFGLVAPEQATKAKWLADAFLQLVKTIAAPVIFVTVVIGIASLGNLARAGALAVRALGYFFVATTVALVLGLLAGNIVKPGEGLAIAPSDAGHAAAQESIKAAGDANETGLVGFILNDLVPTSFVQPFVENEILRVLFLAILTAVAISGLEATVRVGIVKTFETAAKVVFGMIKYVMWAAPLGAFGGMAFTVASFGGGALKNLAELMVTFWATSAIFVFVVLGALCRWYGFSLLKFIRLIKDEILIVLGTSSSETVLPRLLAKYASAGAHPSVVGVVLPAGYSFNLDGTAIYLTLGALFIVQATGESLPLVQQLALVGLMMLTSKGAAGITGAGLVALTASLQTFGGEFFTPASIAIGLSLVVGIDRIMSEGRALTNVISNGVATIVVAKMMGEMNEERFKAVLDDPGLADPDHPDLVYEAEIAEDLRREAEAAAGAEAAPPPALV